MLNLRLVLVTIFAAATCGIALAQNAPQLLERMTGTWDVRQRMWPGPDAAAVDLPPAIAHRQLIGGTYLEEVMEPGQTVQLYFTPQSVLPRKEFLAFEYVYSRRP
jgi:hypothetical protein